MSNSEESIRSLVFLDSDNRRLLYDSKSILRSNSTRSAQKQGTKASNRNASLGRSNARSVASSFDLFGRSLAKSAPKNVRDVKEEKRSKSEQTFKPQPDTKQLCEMIFGSMSMVYHGCTLKIHPHVRTAVGGSCSYVMISYLSQFDPSTARYRANAMRQTSEDPDIGNMRSASFDVVGESEAELFSLPNSLSSLYIRGDPWASTGGVYGSCPVDSVMTSYMGFGSGGNLNKDEGSEGASQSVASSRVSSVSKQRWQCSVTPFYSAFHDMSDLSIFNSTSSHRSKAKLGIALLFPCSTWEISEWIHTHIALIEGYVNQFKSEVERAFFNKDSFYDLVNEATIQVRVRFTKLITRELQPEPSIWIRLLDKSTKTDAIKCFSSCLSRLSAKELKFLSLSVTMLLSCHLSWVNIVGEVYSPEECTALINESSFARVNKQWAQLCDLFGISTNPPKCNKVVVHGKNQIYVRRYMTLLSYFVRLPSLQKHYVRVPALGKTTSPKQEQSFNSNLATSQTRAFKEWAFSESYSKNNSGDFVEIELVDVKIEEGRRDLGSQASIVKSTTARTLNSRLNVTPLNECESLSSESTLKQISSNSTRSVTAGSRSTSPSWGSKEKQHLASSFTDKGVSCLRVATASSPLNIVGSVPTTLRSKSVVEEWMRNSVTESNQIREFMSGTRKKYNSETVTLTTRKAIEPLPLQNSLLPVTSASGSLDDAREVLGDHFEGAGKLDLLPAAASSGGPSSYQSEKLGSLQDSGFADVGGKDKRRDVGCTLVGFKHPLASSLSSVSSTSAHISSSIEMLNAEPELKLENSCYRSVPMVDSEALCAPLLSPCSRPSASVADSLHGLVSSNFSQDAMLQGLVTNDPKLCVQKIVKETKEYFIVDSKACVLCVDVDKLILRVIDDDEAKCEIVDNAMTSKTMEDALTKAYSLQNIGMRPPFCTSLIDRTLHAMVTKCLTFSDKFLDHPEPKTVLEPVGIHHSDFAILGAISACIRHISSQD